VHAVSVGEVLAAAQLIRELKAALPGWAVAVSTTTQTGQRLAKERLPESPVFYLPLDFRFAVRRYLRALQPKMLVLMESELWPRLIDECAKARVPVVVANARISDRSFPRYMGLRRLWRPLLKMISLFLAQSKETAERLVKIGAPAERVKVMGNLKYDVRAPKQNHVAHLIREAAAGRPIIVAGSTVTDEPLDEDMMLIQAWEGTVRRELRALLILAPRHPERFGEVHAVAIEFPTLLATEMLGGEHGKDAYSGFVQQGDPKEVDIVVLDTIGDLAAVYGIATVAFVGGSLVKRGGHNPLEPAQFAVPVVMGPSFENFRDVVESMRAAKGILIVQNREEIEAALIELLKNREMAGALGQRGREVFEAQAGATARTVQALLSLLQERPVVQR
jgi:3-deoxy-D-manno-octulosonic-acid transferase